MTRALCVAVAALVLAACGGSDEAGPAEEPDVPVLPATELYEANATVLEAEGKGPMLCLGAIAESLPPQCGDVPLAGWDWGAVEGEETAAGTTWGDFRVVGTYDGETFTVVEAGPYVEGEDPSGETDFSPACPEPVGDPAGATQENVGAAEEYATAQPEYVASWITHLEDPGAGPVVYNAVFTGNAAAHEEAIRAVWSGPLCVVEREARSERDLLALRAEAEGALGELGLQMLWSEGPGTDGTIRIGVVADPGGLGQHSLDERYDGLVLLVPALRPLAG